MTHVTATSPRARVTDHAVRRYCERYLGAVLDETLDDQKALPFLPRPGTTWRGCEPDWPTSGGC